MTRLFSLPAAIAMVLALTPAAACQSRNDVMTRPVPAADAIGLWEIRTADTPASGFCRLALRGEASGDGHMVVLDDCGLKLPGRTDHWRASPTGFDLRDAGGAPLIAFTADTLDRWTGVGADGLAYQMVRAAMY